MGKQFIKSIAFEQSTSDFYEKLTRYHFQFAITPYYVKIQNSGICEVNNIVDEVEGSLSATKRSTCQS